MFLIVDPADLKSPGELFKSWEAPGILIIIFLAIIVIVAILVWRKFFRDTFRF